MKKTKTILSVMLLLIVAVSIPARAIFNIEHEREGNSEEVEFQFKWVATTK